jgi:ubiquinone/menaquinone biosynthesis C-methylase UbiE
MNEALDSNNQDSINKVVYHRKGIELAYTNRSLNIAESMALLKYRNYFADHSVLDIGVGTGRTALYLYPLARKYVAIDYSPIMIEYMHKTMPQVPALMCDARDLSQFHDNEFEFIFGSNNVIDALAHEDRLRCLKEISRVLKPGGMLMFSSHNRDLKSSLRKPHITWSRNPVDSAIRIRNWLRSMTNRAKIARHQREEPDYALYCDSGHDYCCIHYYIDQRSQRSQLESLKFDVLEVMNPDGQQLQPNDIDANSHWLMYVAIFSPA